MFRRPKGIREGSQEKEQLGKELARAEKELEEVRKALTKADDLITQQRLRITQLLKGEDPRGVRVENKHRLDIRRGAHRKHLAL